MKNRIILCILVIFINESTAQFLDALLIGMSWNLKETKVRQDALTNIKFQIVVNASEESQVIRGTGLWDVAVFGSAHSSGRGKRFDERDNLLTPSQQAIPTLPAQGMVFDEVSTPFKLSVLGCSEYKFLCVEFKQGDDPNPSFFFASMDFEDTIIVCANIDCEQGTGSNDVMLIGMWWTVDAYVRQGLPSDVTITSTIKTSPNHGGVSGEDLWRMKLFINSQNDGKGDSLPQRRDQILNKTESSKDIQPGQMLNITGTASIDLTGVGCGEFRFLCIEFGKGSDPKPEFGFTLGSGEPSMISCRELSCPDDRRVKVPDEIVSDGTSANTGEARDGRVFRVDALTWEMTARDVAVGTPSDLIINVIVYVADDSDFITGNNLWRIGLYGSESADGSTSLRSNYVRQVLPGSQRNQLFAQGLDTVMMVRTMYDISHVGCGSFKYICLEFTKNDLATPDFEIVSNMGDVLSSCQQARCIRPKLPVVPTRRIPVALSGLPSFYLSSMDWQMRAHISKSHLSSFLLDIFITADKRSNDIDGISLWRVAMFGSRNPDGSGRRMDISDQILPVIHQSASFSKTVPLQFTGIRGQEDMRGMYCTDIRFLCIEFGKHRKPNPDFNFYAGPDSDTLSSCQEIPCENPEDRTTSNSATEEEDDSNNGGAGGHGAGGNGGVRGHGGDGGQGSGSSNRLGGGGEPAVGPPIYERGVLTACTVSGVRIAVRANIAISPCQTCQCSSSGVVVCVELSCLRPLTCNEPVFIAEKCCATCLGEVAQPRENLPCIFNGQIVLHNQEFHTSDCIQCICQDGSMTCVHTCFQSSDVVGQNVTLSTVSPTLRVQVTATDVLNPPPVYPRDVNIIKVNIRIQFNNELSTNILGADLWSLQVWGSLKANGGGPKLSYSTNALRMAQRSQDLILDQPFVFTDVIVVLDMSDKTCKQLKFVCVMFEKSENPPFEFEFNKTHSKANVKCQRLTCIR
ncbi:uncharacterized protein [Antedon mediterranea]|uniref:uncharacterized protein n=1 Tax=Antedon mediterranea TaxID=105859 RepID=UPI003AF6F39F